MSINPVFAPTADRRPLLRGRRGHADVELHRGDPQGRRPHLRARPAGALRVEASRASRASRGVFYNADQDIRTVSYTRYENTRNWVLRRHPEVSLYTFLPANQLRRLMSVNPMDHRPYLEIWRGAYLGTLRRIHALGYRMRGDLAAHGIAFDPPAPKRWPSG